MPLTLSNPEDMQGGLARKKPYDPVAENAAAIAASEQQRSQIRQRFEANAVNPGALTAQSSVVGPMSDPKMPRASAPALELPNYTPQPSLPNSPLARKAPTAAPAQPSLMVRGPGAMLMDALGGAAPAAAPTAAPVTPLDPNRPYRRGGGSYGSMATGAAKEAVYANPDIEGMKTLDGRSGGLASSVNAQGNNVYDNNSILRLQRRNGEQAQPAVAGGGGNFGGYSEPNGGPAVPGTIAPAGAARAGPAGTYAGNLSAPVINDYSGGDVAAPNVGVTRRLQGDVAGAETERKQRLAQLETALGNIGDLNTRGKKDLFANLMAAKSQLTESRIKTAGDFESQGAKEENDAASLQATLAAKIGEGNADRTQKGLDLKEQSAERRDRAKSAADAIAAENDPKSFKNQSAARKQTLEELKADSQLTREESKAGREEVMFAAQTDPEYAKDPAAAIARAQENYAVSRNQADIPIAGDLQASQGDASLRRKVASESEFGLRNLQAIGNTNGDIDPSNLNLDQLQLKGKERWWESPYGRGLVSQPGKDGTMEDRYISGDTYDQLSPLAAKRKKARQ